MTLEELYRNIEGDYTQALRVLRVEKLIDKHVRRFESGNPIGDLLEAGSRMDAQQIFEAAHAAKGVCGNLGLLKLASAASEMTEEFRPGTPRRLSDAQTREKLAALEALYGKTLEGIRAYMAD